MELYYINRRQKKVKVAITYHARSRFIERYNRIFTDKPIYEIEEVDKAIEKWWNLATEKPSTTGKLKVRTKRHGKDTIYFISNYFMFIVQDAAIVTIELGSKDTRHLNNKKGLSPIHKKHKDSFEETRNGEES